MFLVFILHRLIFSFFLSARPKGSLLVGAVSAAVLVMMGAGCGQVDTVSAPVVPSAPTNEQGAVMPLPTFGSFKDGTYTAKGTYSVHSGPEEITISLTLKDGLITDTTFAGTPAVKMSQKFMDMFAENYKPMVIGKKISEVKLGKVSGSSLTPMGFNEAVEKIKQQAGQSS
ncbi:hypothetical protein KBB85_02235 [Patescibacteria group bacterium]|nr:hypothetical protein [Patescibacteria group bacterium]